MVEVTQAQRVEAENLAKAICGCSTMEQHRADTKLLLGYRIAAEQSQVAEVGRLRAALVQAEETFDQVLDDMRAGGKCVCGAVKDEIVETHAAIIAALGDQS